MSKSHPMTTILDRRAVLAGAAIGAGSLVTTAFGGTGIAAAAKASRADSDVPISLIGLPYLMGTRAHNSMYGMADGPVRMLEPAHAPASLKSYFKDVEVQMIDNVDEPAQPLPQGDQMARILAENIALADAVRTARLRGRIPIMSIGTCSATLGIVAGLADEKDDIGMIWIDAHADAETPDSTKNGFIEGMVVPMIAGQTWKTYCRALPHFRPIDESRMISMGVSSVKFPMVPKHPGSPMGTIVHQKEIERVGIEAALAPALAHLAGTCRKVFIHMDADTIDPSSFKNFKFRPDITGLNPDVVTHAFNLIAERFEIVAFDLAAFDPNADTRGPAILSKIMLEAGKAAARSQRSG